MNVDNEVAPRHNCLQAVLQVWFTETATPERHLP